ncbi:MULTISPECIES: EscU/YscU/HrcU family type III secretion system export apparatus switch protein [unclassified Pseudomonas]|uniref:EscU/YscU/HrcU family type III secretion system export apparatus switch protein n=1 Tax=unclassified Pseudomonas TaxID=196821 RepID=UPI00244D743B|nr:MULTISPECIES: EscU/YscU/HrcU family type III secretion system export apparatus switch protein [unclassified Pseudomonas]MDG9930375.1 EscU/YscU/HrcU family type III secretion system export apparatus switch protein [Pseudomonas sp. GD04042]MDH0484512.1 EscU/YscU/HrcU family type III secretion system export apparatus switch protein [Pseudomonas sp. GD04015]MDH0606030.1 EscU/YscU/HrcU family type III secretion system export apparatus switch protein [Pseudomonas sp. GD03869]
MSSQDQQDKSEDATPYKLEEARKKGQVARSQELLSFMMVLAFLMVFSATVYQLASVFAMHSHWWLGNAGHMGRDWGYLAAQGGHSLREIAYALLPLIGALVLVAVVTNLIFNGPVFSSTPLKPDFKRLNPVTGLKRMFSRRMLVDLLKVVVKGLLFGLVLYYVAQGLVPELLGLASSSPLELPQAVKQLMMKVGFAVLLVMAAAALFDMWYSRKEYARQMRMSRRELKDEYKRREGDPEMRSKRKSVQQELLSKAAALGKVKDADVIIVNPTHYAVALQYRPSLMRAPVVLAKGRGLLARRICLLARRHSVPILRRPPLARALYAVGRIDAAIPDAMQNDVASVYRWIISIPGNKVVMG